MTHFWPDYTALIAELRRRQLDGATDGIFSRAADALEAERKARTEEYAIAKHLRVEALAAKERAEAELLESRLHVEEMDELLSERWEEMRAAKAEVARLTAALARARWALHDVLDDVDRALSHPTTEPAKAEGYDVAQ